MKYFLSFIEGNSVVLNSTAVSRKSRFKRILKFNHRIQESETMLRIKWHCFFNIVGFEATL